MRRLALRVFTALSLLAGAFLPLSGSAQAVYNGYPESEANFPWLGQLNSPQTCGVTLIRQDVLLTAAHCVAGSTTFAYTFRASWKYPVPVIGYYKNIKPDIPQSPPFDTTTYLSDIALLFLPHSVGYFGHLKRPTVPLSNVDAPGVWTTEVGRGCTTSPTSSVCGNPLFKLNGMSSRILDRGMNESTCMQTAYTDLCLDSGHAVNRIGDSGGPALFQDSRGKWSQIGVISTWASGTVNGRLDYICGATSINTERAWITSELASHPVKS